MSEPRRLSVDDPMLAKMLGAARRERPTEASRIRALQLASVGAAAGVATGAHWTSSATLKVTLALVAVTGAALVAARHVAAPVASSPAVVIASAPSTIAAPSIAAPTPVVEIAPIEPAASAAPIASTVVAKKTVAPVASATIKPVEDASGELALLTAAHAALKSGDGAGALESIATWRKRYTGLYAEEAEALEVDALVTVGARDKAAKLAALFVSKFPDSPQAARMAAVAKP